MRREPVIAVIAMFASAAGVTAALSWTVLAGFVIGVATTISAASILRGTQEER
jgi:hypothetical protein